MKKSRRWASLQAHSFELHATAGHLRRFLLHQVGNEKNIVTNRNNFDVLFNIMTRFECEGTYDTEQ